MNDHCSHTPQIYLYGPMDVSCQLEQAPTQSLNKLPSMPYFSRMLEGLEARVATDVHETIICEGVIIPSCCSHLGRVSPFSRASTEEDASFHSIKGDLSSICPEMDVPPRLSDAIVAPGLRAIDCIARGHLSRRTLGDRSQFTAR